MKRSPEHVESEGAGGKETVDRAELELQIARLKTRHTEIEERLVVLDRHLSLTSDEQLERAQLKKEKLWSKDRIAALSSHLPMS